MNKLTTIKTEDGYTFFLLVDGRYADSFEEVISAFHVEEIDYHVYFN